MAEFKITKQLSPEIAALDTRGKALNAEYAAADATEIKNMSAAYEFVKEQTRIKNLLDLYASLLAKDAQDLNAMVNMVEAADSSAASSYTS